MQLTEQPMLQDGKKLASGIFFNSSGNMQKGWIQPDGYWYYLRPALNTPTTGPEGSMATGWRNTGKWKVENWKLILSV